MSFNRLSEASKTFFYVGSIMGSFTTTVKLNTDPTYDHLTSIQKALCASLGGAIGGLVSAIVVNPICTLPFAIGYTGSEISKRLSSSPPTAS